MHVEIPERLNIADYFLDARIREGRGDARALVCGGRTWTYAEVQEQSHAAGNVLLEMGVEPEQRVLIALPDGPEFVAAFFGALKIGAVVVMANPELSGDAMARCYAYTRAKVAIIPGSRLQDFDEARLGLAYPPTLLVAGPVEGDLGPGQRRLEKEVDRASRDLPTFDSHRDDPAIWLFSGGTTGTPKAVVQTHASFVNTTRLYAQGVLGYCDDDVVLSVPKLYFGYATGANLLFPFAVGATAILYPQRCSPELLFDLIHQFRPTILINVPTMANKMVVAAEGGGER